jgi:hypothetical protein
MRPYGRNLAGFLRTTRRERPEGANEWADEEIRHGPTVWGRPFYGVPDSKQSVGEGLNWI